MDDAKPINDPASPDCSGGVGAPRRQSGRASLADLRLWAHALRQGWSVPDELKQTAVKRVAEILKDDKAGSRSWIAANRALVSMTTVTLASIDTALRAQASEDFEKRLAALEAQRDGIPNDQQTDQA